MKINYSIVIHRPVDEVFAFVTDLRNERQWQPEIEAVHLPAEPLQTGSEFEEERRTFGRRYTWRFRVTVLTPNREFSIATVRGTPVYTGSRLFEAVPGGTKLSEIGEVETRGLMKLFDPLFARLAQKPQNDAFHRLKRLLEVGQSHTDTHR
jgi:uncharacterized membrane protein